MKPISFTIPVIPRTKKNSSQMIFKGGRPILIPSKLYKQFETDCLKCISGQYKLGINTPVNIKATFFVENKIRKDLNNLLEAIDDVLVRANVVEDDNYKIIAGHDGSRVYYDKENPRIEITITDIEEEK